MKISRKMKKFFVSILTATLSIIMFATQTSALNVKTRSAEFTDDRQILQATEWITWDKNRNWLLVGVDLSIDENDYYSIVRTYFSLTIENTTYPSPDPYFEDTQSGIYDYSDTWDSDEILYSFTDFDPVGDSYTITATITYDIYYYDGGNVEYTYENIYTITLNGELQHTRSDLSNNAD